jgi:septum formation protein
MQLILASASEGRKKLLSLLKIPFKIIPSILDEEKIVGKTPLETLKLRARRKGEEVAYSVIRDQLSEISKKKLTTDNRQLTTYFILSADSGAILDNHLIGKPKDYQDAVRILKTLSGRTHEFVTAVYSIKISIKAGGPSEGSQSELHKEALIKYIPYKTRRLEARDWDTQGTGPEIASSLVTFRKLTNEEIKLYLSLSDYTKYAGGYTVSATPQTFITKIEGSISNVIGLPLEKIIPVLRENQLI